MFHSCNSQAFRGTFPVAVTIVAEQVKHIFCSPREIYCRELVAVRLGEMRVRFAEATTQGLNAHHN
jgi:hypothetical protein